MLSAAISLLLPAAAVQQDVSVASAPPGSRQVTATSRELLAMANQAMIGQREDIAIKILEVLLEDREQVIRNEARFLLAMLAVRREDWTGAGLNLRKILDEEPGAQRARLELARVQAEMGDLNAARRTLREAQAGGLPPEIARIVQRFAAALREKKPFGVNLQMAIAPDSNINRATRSDFLETVLGDFRIDEAAQETSGIGFAAKSEAYYRMALSEDTSLLARMGISGNFYRSDEYNDLVAVASVGPEFSLFGGRANVSAGLQRRWFGSKTFTDGLAANMDWQRAVGKRAYLRAGVGYAHSDNHFNDLQDSDAVNGFVSIERAFSPRYGASVTLGGLRQRARDPAYSLTSAQVSSTAWHEFGSTTLFATGTYQRLEADRRLAIYPERRKDDLARISLGIANRSIQFQGWSPQVKLGYEKNFSPIEIYQFDRWFGEFGVVRAF